MIERRPGESDPLALGDAVDKLSRNEIRDVEN
jgi:hypothetical protein